MQKTHPVILITVILLTGIFFAPLYAQKAGVKGVVLDSTGKGSLHYAVVALINKKDSILTTSSRSTGEGKFTIDKIKPGNYTVLVTYPEMADFLVDVSLGDTGVTDIGKVIMSSRYHLLQEVVVRSGKAIRMKGDTLEFKADSFYVREGANVEELLRRLPGIQIGPDGKIKAQGKEVTSVLVDGDEFFNDDPTLVTQYLKSSSVDKVQIYDSKSAQSQLTGIDDGVRNKTMNIKLKENSKNGMFGKAALGTNASGLYSHEGMLNVFRGKEKIAVFGLGSNTVTTGISYQDKSKFFTEINAGIEDETGRLIGNMFDLPDFDYDGGLPSTIRSGGQYANKWKEGKITTNLNYRFNQTRTIGWQISNETQLLPDSSIRSSSSKSNSSSYQQQHSGGGYYEARIDSFSTIKVIVDAQKQNSISINNSYSDSRNDKGDFLNQSEQLNSTEGNKSGFNSTVQLQKRFRKMGRMASFTLIQNHNNVLSTRLAETLSFYYSGNNTNPPGDSLNQMQFNKNNVNSIAARITYTEPISKKIFLSTEYSWRLTSSDRDRDVLGKGVNGKYDTPVDSLSNHYRFNIHSHMPGMVLQFNENKIRFSTGGKINYTTLTQIDRDLKTTGTRSFINLFPQARVEYELSKQRRISFNYNGRTSQPSIEQLQPLLDNSNPLYVRIGNPDLRPSFSHGFNVTYSSFNFSGNSININVNWSQTLNSIISTERIDQFNKTTAQFINRNSFPSLGLFINMFRQLGKPTIKGNGTIGFNFNVHRSAYQRILNNNEIVTRQTNFSAGPHIGFYRNKVFNIDYSSHVSYSISNASIGNIGSNTLLSHNHNAHVVFFLPWKLEFSSDVDMYFQPSNSSFNTSRNIIKWNASMIKKFMKNDQAQLRLSVNDILNQNTGYDRGISGNSFYESASNFIPRYGILSFVWNFSTKL